MEEKELDDWINQSKNKQILELFSVPKTPTWVQKELHIKKFSLKPFLKRQLIKCLNPGTHKGRLYLLTNKSRRLLNVPDYECCGEKDYDLIGWVQRGPKQRYVVLKTLVRDSVKRTSEDIRKRSSSLNPCLSRISTKGILKELINMELADSEMGDDRRRYYWVNEKGRLIANDLTCPFPKEYSQVAS